MLDPQIWFLGLMSGLVDTLRPYAAVVLSMTFVWTFLFGLAAVAFGDRKQWLKDGFIAYIFIGLLACNFVLPLAPHPFVSWGHFSEPTTETVTYEELRLVDERGAELKFDSRATLTFDSASMRPVRERVRKEAADGGENETARALIEQASAYRKSVKSRSTVDKMKFPHHGLTSTWDPKTLDQYGEFVGIRLYEMTFVTTPDGTTVTEYEETVVAETFVKDVSVGPHPPRSMLPRSINRSASSEIDHSSSLEQPYPDKITPEMQSTVGNDMILRAEVRTDVR